METGDEWMCSKVFSLSRGNIPWHTKYHKCYSSVPFTGIQMDYGLMFCLKKKNKIN